ncbi:hypothetical protein [Vibrio superstes]|uniref:Lipoprotein n=1 Tax=Vibrio superstes NBRC 103154 TaxID=1219062 RepID=A0A511QLD6_9VIBR|nr:hypothetical protein [Vibrio superstes]GEM78081.1 hypothetical protein VSU01S_03260 [Vibrio superstes NBRC 103154]
MKRSLLALALTPVILTGCGSSNSNDHEVQKVLKNSPAVVALQKNQKGIDALVKSSSQQQQSKSQIIQGHTQSSKNLKNKEPISKEDHDGLKKTDNPGQDAWIADNQQIAMVFEDAGFTESQVYQLCETRLTSDATFSCELEGTDNNQQSAIYTMYYRKIFAIDANSKGFIQMTYNPDKKQMKLSKTFYSDDANTLSRFAKLKVVAVDGVSSAKVKVTKKSDQVSKKSQVTVEIPLNMDSGIVKQLKNMYLNNQESNAINKLTLIGNPNFQTPFTKGMAKSDQFGDDLAVFNSNIRQIITVAAQ